MFFLPLFDENPSHRVPIITWLIMAVCIGVFFYQATLHPQDAFIFVKSYGAIPALVTGADLRPFTLSDIPNEATLVTSMFMHGGWLHLGGNMLYLWIFGDNIEDSFGRVKFILFYLACGVAATMTHILIAPASSVPLVGASGAIAGILAAYLLLFPHAQVRVIVIILIFIRWVSFPAIVILAGWMIVQFISAPASLLGDGGGVAYFAHIGGFVAGLILTPFFKRRHQPFFAGKPKSMPMHLADGGNPFASSTNQHRQGRGRKLSRNAFLDRYRRQDKTKDQNDGRGPWG